MIFEKAIKVACNRELGRTEVVYLRYTISPDGSVFGFCNGCEWCCGVQACSDCISHYTSLLNSHPERLL